MQTLCLFSYLVDHDYGFAPSISQKFCTLCKCKYRKKRPNIVELAQLGDWAIGTGGANLITSAGHGKLIYAMRVDEKPSLVDYYADHRFRLHLDHFPELNDPPERFALVSHYFFYIGRNAADIPEPFLSHPLEKKGPRYRSDFNQEFIYDFIAWLEDHFAPGVLGLPCKPLHGLLIDLIPSQ